MLADPPPITSALRQIVTNKQMVDRKHMRRAEIRQWTCLIQNGLEIRLWVTLVYMGHPWPRWVTLGHLVIVNFIWTVYDLYITVIVDANVVQHGGTWNTMGVGPIEFEWKAARPRVVSCWLRIHKHCLILRITHSFKILNASSVQ